MILREIINGGFHTRSVECAFDEKYDLVVVGVGTAGAISLITASREGLSVLGVEQLYCMGGTSTIGAITGYYFGAEGGVYTELDAKAKALQSGELFHEGNRRDAKAVILEREARKSGAKIRYECIVTGVYLEENKVTGVRLFQNGKTIHVGAKCVIDATGEATVAYIAGSEVIFGREFDGQTQPATSSSILIDDKGKVFATNKDAGFVNQQDPRDVSRVIIESNNFPMYLKADYTSDSKKFVAVAPLFGVREGRRIKGKKILKLEDVVKFQNREEKPLFYAYSNIDNHGKDIAFENEDLCDWMVASGLWGVLMSVPISMETMLPEGLENIIIAGRCLSVDHNLAACVRMRRDMTKSGEAAAYICSEAIKKNILISKINYDNIVDKLKANKCLNEANNVGFMERIAGKYFGYELPELKTAEEILDWLSGEKPGWAIWTARTIARKGGNAQLIRRLESALVSENENLARHSALALGIMGEKCAIPKLQQMALEPDNCVPKSSLKYIYTRGVSAIYLLGKLGDADSVEMLFKIVDRRGQVDLDEFTFGEFYHETNDVSSQYVLFAVRALVEIAKIHPEYQMQITTKLKEVLSASDYHIWITLRDNSTSLYDLKPKLMRYIVKNIYSNDQTII